MSATEEMWLLDPGRAAMIEADEVLAGEKLSRCKGSLNFTKDPKVERIGQFKIGTRSSLAAPSAAIVRADRASADLWLPPGRSEEYYRAYTSGEAWATQIALDERLYTASKAANASNKKIADVGRENSYWYGLTMSKSILALKDLEFARDLSLKTLALTSPESDLSGINLFKNTIEFGIIAIGFVIIALTIFFLM